MQSQNENSKNSDEKILISELDKTDLGVSNPNNEINFGRGILVIQTAFLGDLLLGTPFLKKIKNLYPNDPLYLVCRKGFGAFIKDLGLIDEFFEIEKKNKKSYQAISEKLEKFKLKIIYSPHESLTTAFLVNKIKATRKISFKKWWNFLFYNERILKDKELPEPLRQMSLLINDDRDFGQKLNEFKEGNRQWNQTRENKLLFPIPDWASPLIFTNSKDPQLGESSQQIFHSKPLNFSKPDIAQWLIEFDGSDKKAFSAKLSKFMQQRFKILVLFPGSVWKTKQWTESGFRSVALSMARQYDVILLLGTPQERELCLRIATGIENAKVLAGQTSLQETLKILRGTDLVIANDSAGQHLAALVGCPSVSIFGPTVQRFGYRPWNSKAVIVENHQLKCRPCGLHGHHQCPIGTHECMTSISAENVIEASQALTQIANKSN